MSLRLEFDGPRANLLIDRAQTKNAFTQQMWEDLPRLLAEAQANPATRVLVLRSSTDGAFCAGADIGEMVANKDNEAWLERNQSAIMAAQYQLTRLPLPTIAFIDGACFGGGCGLALACDMRLATSSAKFAITPARLGLVYPLHDIGLLVDLVGPGQASRMLFAGSPMDAAEALRIGLIEQVCEIPDDLANAIAANSAFSIRHMKSFVRSVRDGQREEDDQTRAIFAAAFREADFAEGARAFMEKRKAQF